MASIGEVFASSPAYSKSARVLIYVGQQANASEDSNTTAAEGDGVKTFSLPLELLTRSSPVFAAMFEGILYIHFGKKLTAVGITTRSVFTH